MIDAMILDGTVTLIALGAIVLELGLFFAFARSRSAGGIGGLAANALSGACLILALRAALLDYGPKAIALFLGLGLLAHLWDIVIRIKNRK
jgi:hypothetical protein